MPSDDSVQVKKDEVEDEEDGSILETLKKKPNNATPRSRIPKQAKVKKEESDEDDFEEKPSAKKISNKVQKKSKIKEVETKKGAKVAERNGKKRERKVYDLPGQKRDPPEERDPLRIFYETLYNQVPDSEMAAFWMMESGLLAKEVAKTVFERKEQKKQKDSPMKTTVTMKKTTKSVTVTKKTPSSPVSSQKKTPASKEAPKQSKKRKIDDDASEDDSDDDYVLAKRMPKKQKAA